MKIYLIRPIFFFVFLLSSITGSVIADFEKGIQAYQANDLALAYKEFRASADEGHVDSQFNVPLMFENGIGIEKDEKKALLWYEKSAEQGNAAAQYNLEVLYENGRGTNVDFSRANKWYRKASVQGDAFAIGNLGMLYIRGDGVAVNKVAGVALLLASVTLDKSPDNFARRNISMTPGLTPELVSKAQVLSDEMMKVKDLLVPLDAYLKQMK